MSDDRVVSGVEMVRLNNVVSGDFIHKLSIAQKECGETIYWLDLIHETGFLPTEQYSDLHTAADGLSRMLKSAIITSKNKLKKK